MPLHQANWMTAHASQLAETVPKARYRWTWPETEVDAGHLQKLRDWGLIKPTHNGHWHSTRRLMQAIADYGNIPQAEVGVKTGQLPLGVEP